MAQRKKTKFLIETSAVPVAIGRSTSAHCEYFAQLTEGGTLFTSVYIRKEFVHRWIRYYIKMAFTVDHFADVPSALFHLNQSFSARDVKTENQALAVLLQEKGRITNCRGMAKELGRLAVGELKKFDKRFQSRIGNSSGCRIGAKELKVDYNYFFADLRRFVDSLGIVSDCPVNEFLGFSKYGNAPRLLEIDEVGTTKSGQQLAKLYGNRKWITCIECARIGDAIIALEQPRTVCLVHIDRDFKILCAATQRPHRPMPAERAVENRVNGI